MKQTKQFQTESKRLLHLMTHSIYTHHEIFLRELISNASDAIDKRHFKSLTDERVTSTDYEIRIIADEQSRTLKIIDNGIGLTEEELIENLGTIAKSGTKAFQESLEDAKDMELIGQFGVGFYSAFMVAEKVEVKTRSSYDASGYLWSSDGVSSYTIEPLEKEIIGTEITLFIREDAEDIDFSKFLKFYELKSLVKKYSDYIRYPIKMLETKTEDKKEIQEDVTLNQMTPIWKRSKSDVKDEDMNEFFKHQFNEYEAPLKTIHTNVEGMLTYTALLFIPKKPAYNFYSESFEKGLQLYSKSVFIEDKNKALIPDYFKFVKGLVDSADLSLNLSREMLQHDRQLNKIASHLEKKIKSELESLLTDDRKTYLEFYEAYKLTLKYGIYEMFGMNKDKLQDLILFETSKSDELITLKEYLDRKPESQKYIYYATGKSKSRMLNLPQMDTMKSQDIEVLLCYDDVDEFMFQAMQNYQEITFKSIQQGELEDVLEDKKKEVKKQEKDYKAFLSAMKDALKNQVKDVKVSARLTESPVCIVSGEGVSLEMEKVLNQMPNGETIKAERILEVNPNHELFKKLYETFQNDAETIGSISSLLYHQSLVAEGIPLENPKEYTDALTALLSKK
jgi:molecular chaperone HtpG